MLSYVFIFFFFNQKTAYDVRISDWSSDVCSSDLEDEPVGGRDAVAVEQRLGEVGRGAAQRDALALAELAVDDDAGDALERLGDILVGEFRSEERRVGTSVSVRVDLGGRRIIKKKI